MEALLQGGTPVVEQTPEPAPLEAVPQETPRLFDEAEFIVEREPNKTPAFKRRKTTAPAVGQMTLEI